MVHPCWCEALPTMYRIPQSGRGGSREATAFLEASSRVRARIPGDMVNTSERSLAPSRGASQMRLTGLKPKGTQPVRG